MPNYFLYKYSTDFGQTGTYIGLDYLIEEGLELGNIDIKACVSQLRKQRSSFIETCVSKNMYYCKEMNYTKT